MAQFTITAAELEPALQALYPLTRNVKHTEPQEYASARMVYCHLTHEGKMVLLTSDQSIDVAAAVAVDISDFDGTLTPFAIDRDNLKQIISIFKPRGEDPVHLVVDVQSALLPVGVVEEIKITERDALHSPVSLSFSGAKRGEISWQAVLDGLLASGREIRPAPFDGVLPIDIVGKLGKATKIYSVTASIPTAGRLHLIFGGSRMFAVVGLMRGDYAAMEAQQDEYRYIMTALQGVKAKLADAESVEGAVSIVSKVVDAYAGLTQDDFELAAEVAAG